jgi:tRNA-uridine 2-sulfurtransferase
MQLYDHGEAVKRSGSCCAGPGHLRRQPGRRPARDCPLCARLRKPLPDRSDRTLRRRICSRANARAVHLCNQGVKFVDLIGFAREVGADCLATGHYVQRVINLDRLELHKGADPKRDQSYFLYGTTAEQLDFLRFPLGDLPKTKCAGSRSRQAWRSHRSRQPGYLLRSRRRLCVAGQAASARDRSSGGNRRSRRPSARRAPRSGPLHRRAAPRDRDRRKSRAALRRSESSQKRAGSSSVRAARSPCSGCGRGAELDRRNQHEVSAKVRSLAPAVPATIDGEWVRFAKPEYGVAPGQAAVFYDGTRVLGGGWIAETEAADPRVACAAAA